MLKDERWPVARLIPISSASGVEAQGTYNCASSRPESATSWFGTCALS
jgi:hypothetical protein